MPDLAWVTPDYIARVLDASLNGDCPEEEHALYDLRCRTWPRLVKNVTELKNAVCGLQWNVQDEEGLSLIHIFSYYIFRKHAREKYKSRKFQEPP